VTAVNVLLCGLCKQVEISHYAPVCSLCNMKQFGALRQLTLGADGSHPPLHSGYEDAVLGMQAVRCALAHVCTTRCSAHSTSTACMSLDECNT